MLFQTSVSSILLASGLFLSSTTALSPKKDAVKAPQMKHLFTSYLMFNMDQPPPQIETKQGTMVNAAMLYGNWTAPNGKLIATIVPGYSGEVDLVDNSGVVNIDCNYVVKFADDALGLVKFIGMGTIDVRDQGIITVHTESPLHQDLTGKNLFAPGKFVGRGMLKQEHFEQLYD